MKSTIIKIILIAFLAMVCIVNNACKKHSIKVPTVSTADITAIAATTADSGGDVTNDGGETLISRGLCWSTHHNPTIADYCNYEAIHIGTFYSGMKNLMPLTHYYVRAFASNSAGVAYGDEKSFTTVVQ